MLKFTGRFLFFLTISILLSVGVFAIVQRNPIPLGLGVGENHSLEEAPDRFSGKGLVDHENLESQETGFRERGHHGEGREGSFTGLLGVGKNLFLIALITMVVVGAQKIIAHTFRRQPAKAVISGG